MFHWFAHVFLTHEFKLFDVFFKSLQTEHVIFRLKMVYIIFFVYFISFDLNHVFLSSDLNHDLIKRLISNSLIKQLWASRGASIGERVKPQANSYLCCITC